MSAKLHPAWIEFLERVAEFVKGFGAALAKLAYRLKTEPNESEEEKKGH